jgi:EmrB/QacA subfamily drug resistance transporter
MEREDPQFARRWLILAVVGIAQLMVVLDVTVVNVALPSAQKALHFTNSERQWIITGYSLAFASLVLLGGKISDLFGRKWTFVAGLCGFSIASVVGGASQSFAMFVGARVVQGAFAAVLAPAALSLVTTTFAGSSERNTAFGIFGAIAGSGASLGLLLGGVLTQILDWRYVMFVNVLFAAVAVAGALTLLRNERSAERPRLDLPGTASVSAGLFAVVFGFSHADTTTWSNPVTLASLAAGVLLLALFAAIEARSAHPLLPLRVLADRNRGAALLSIVIAAASMFGVFLFLSYYLQLIRGYSPIKTGLAFLPMSLVLVATSTIAAAKLRSRMGPRPLVVTGMGLAAASMAYLTRLGVHSAYAIDILPALIALGIGLGLVFSTALNSATFGVEARDAGVASATVNTMQQVGGSVGTALLSTVAASATAGVGAAAAVHGYTTAFEWSAVMFVIGAIVPALLFSRVPATADSTARSEPLARADTARR